MSRLDLDLTELGRLATQAAAFETPTARREALNTVFAECGERASAYYCPDAAAADFVRWVTLDYQGARRATRESAGAPDA